MWYKIIIRVRDYLNHDQYSGIRLLRLNNKNLERGKASKKNIYLEKDSYS